MWGHTSSLTLSLGLEVVSIAQAAAIGELLTHTVLMVIVPPGLVGTATTYDLGQVANS